MRSTNSRVIAALGTVVSLLGASATAAPTCKHQSVFFTCNASNCVLIAFSEFNDGSCTAPITQIERQPAGGGSWTTICTDCSTGVTDCGATPGQLYNYRFTTTCSGCSASKVTTFNNIGCPL